jgi:cytochrome c553
MMKKTVLALSMAGLTATALIGCSGSDNGSSQSSQQAAPEAAKEAPKTTTPNIQPSAASPAQTSAADVKQAPVATPAQTEASTGESLYARCVGCHGATGEGGVGPKLKGQSKLELMTKLKGYRDGKQYGPMTSMMAPNVSGFSDEDIEKVADYIAKL